ncbi:16S rRNA (adenine(1518)-N(6)/adenine(1519)-N(6))-dimethyltransferase RsmA [Mycoavidus sp. SF9855]|uniref:16S rRNA (adenine(1518)-N(6)/adenine(1519)-N(6))- dimethyltransferase RsmA n=1 Tax=Mycoavidus sp. SF9855 TaxID=2968475 RepID=UPI00211CACC6|nr:16S rRNA (adenine(1518)-N(6)/adenine(1519)-N(6))-dimethyltransferase RsmA [Mycoavidus sp. SF9855]UUM21924.1 16S rRNA (adenine(1518)-N(6)/adenine(1519)-N(6))-dimethyltransferase RsmA [Mycoavidus sp. SF9855]
MQDSKFSSVASQRHQGHIARKRFGQNFLVDTGVIERIAAAIAPQPDQCVIEIGPGLGALTGPLLTHLGVTGVLHAIELDRDLIVRLQKRFGAQLILHAGDALTFDFRALAMAQPVAPALLRIVGNLPYNISTPLLFHLLSCADWVVDQHFMLQSELVERLVASPGSKAYGRLSVMLQYRYELDKLIDVPPTAFSPAPKVDSAVIRMVPRPSHTLPEVNWVGFSEVVAAAFSQRRKMLRNTLAAYRTRIDFDAMGFDLARRAEEVAVSEYVALAQQISAR